MALANVLTPGASAADSSDTTIAAVTRFVLKAAAGAPSLPNDGYIDVLVKDDAGLYWPIAFLGTPGYVYVDLQPGTYLFRRKAGGAVGVFSAA